MVIPLLLVLLVAVVLCWYFQIMFPDWGNDHVEVRNAHAQEVLARIAWNLGHCLTLNKLVDGPPGLAYLTAITILDSEGFKDARLGYNDGHRLFVIHCPSMFICGSITFRKWFPLMAKRSPK